MRLASADDGRRTPRPSELLLNPCAIGIAWLADEHRQWLAHLDEHVTRGKLYRALYPPHPA